MQIQIRHDENVQGDKNEWITSTVQDVLGRYGEQVTTVEVHLADENGSKHAEGDIRATVEVRPAGFNPIAATSHGNDIAMALEAALDKVVRMLDGMLGRVRDHHGNL
jgi:ribosome-associated translation inhibitor RaiA